MLEERKNKIINFANIKLNLLGHNKEGSRKKFFNSRNE